MLSWQSPARNKVNLKPYIFATLYKKVSTKLFSRCKPKGGFIAPKAPTFDPQKVKQDEGLEGLMPDSIAFDPQEQPPICSF